MAREQFDQSVVDEFERELRFGRDVQRLEDARRLQAAKQQAITLIDQAGNRAEDEAEAVERGGGEAVAAGQSGGPQRFLVVEDGRAALDRGQSFVDVHEAAAGDQPLDRDPAEASAQFDQDAVFERIEGREVAVAALGDRMTLHEIE